MDDTLIRQIILHTCRRCGCPELAKGIVVIYHLFGNNIMADAEYLGDNMGIIRINILEWKGLNIIQKYELIIHEVAHVAVDALYPHHNEPFHGYLWKSLMKCAGISKPKALMYI